MDSELPGWLIYKPKGKLDTRVLSQRLQVITGLSTIETGALGVENFYANTGEADTRLHPLSFRAYFLKKSKTKTNPQNHNSV